MRGFGFKGAWLAPLGAIACALALFAGTSSAQAAPEDPLFIFTPKPAPFSLVPPPTGSLGGPCGLAVNPAGDFAVADHYHRVIDFYDQDANYNAKTATGSTGYLGQIGSVDPLSGPCQMAYDAAGTLYVNEYHRSVIDYSEGTAIAGQGVDGTHPTGLATDPATNDVYVNARTHIAVFDETGAPVMDGAEPLRIGTGSLQDGYGLAPSSFPGTEGHLYVPDAGSNTVKVYDPSTDKANPIAEIDGADTPNGGFASLRDAAIAVDRVSGEIYLLDNLQPKDTERPQAVVYVFDSTGAYQGHLKFLVTDALPSGLAVDNSASASQGRVYVTSGNTASGSIYAYPPGAATTAPINLSGASLAQTSSGPGEGAVVQTAGSKASKENGSNTPTAQTSQTQVKGNLISTVDASLQPKKLPRKGKAPVAVSIAWKVATQDGTEPPTLRKLAIEINRAGVLDPTGLPLCPYAQIQPASTQRALANCRPSLVGKGSFSALAGLEGQERYVAKGKMVLFNAQRQGKPVLFGQIYSAYPFANSFVIVFKVDRKGKGAYGTTLTATLPANLRAWGNLTEIQMRLHRTFSFKGEKRSFLSAGCPAPKGFDQAPFRLARTSFAFDGGTEITSTITGDCRARG